MPKGVYKRKKKRDKITNEIIRKRGRPKGSKNKVDWRFQKAIAEINKLPVDFVEEASATENLKSRLDECMTKLETAVFEAINKLKGSI